MKQLTEGPDATVANTGPETVDVDFTIVNEKKKGSEGGLKIYDAEELPEEDKVHDRDEVKSTKQGGGGGNQGGGNSQNGNGSSPWYKNPLYWLVTLIGIVLIIVMVMNDGDGGSDDTEDQVVKILEENEGSNMNWISSSEQWIEITDKDSVFELRNEILGADYRKVHFQVYDSDVNVRNTIGNTYPIFQTKSANKIGPLNRLSTMVITIRGNSKKARMRWWVE